MAQPGSARVLREAAERLKNPMLVNTHHPLAYAVAEHLVYVADQMGDREPCPFVCIHESHCGVQRSAVRIAEVWIEATGGEY